MRFPDIGYARRQVRRVLREGAHGRSAALRAVATDGPTDELARAYRASYHWLARQEGRRRRVDGFVSPLLGVLLYVPFLALTLPLGHRSVLAVFAYLCGAFVGVAAAFVLLLLIGRMATRWLLLISVSFVAGQLGGAYLLWREVGSTTELLDRIAANVWSAMLAGLVVALLLNLVIAPISFMRAWLEIRRMARTQPRTALLHRLFALTLVLTEPRALTDRRILLLRMLSRAALVLETGLWREVHLSNPLSRATWRDRCRQCAQHLRSFDLAIVLPRADTREYLLAEVVGLIHVLVRGALDDLPVADPPPPRRVAAFLEAVRSLVLGLIPLAAVLGARYVGLEPSGALGGALVVATIVWFALTVLTTLDGQAANRLSLLKDAAEAMSSFRGKP